MTSVAVLFNTDPAQCRRNRARDRAVPATALDAQLRRMRDAVADVPAEGWDLVLPADTAQPEPSHTPGARGAAREQMRRPVRMGFVLDIPVIGRDREHAASIVESLRGRVSAAAFAQRHHAGTAGDHIGRYRLLADRGVTTVFVSLPDLAHPDDVLRLAPVAAAFA
jgi:hypothetical protein